MRQRQRYPPLFSSYDALCTILYRDSVSSILLSITDLIFSVFMFRMFHADFQSLSNNLPRRITARPSRSNGLSCSLVYILPPRSVNRSSPRSIFLRSAQGLSLSFSNAVSLSPSFVPPLVARNTVLVPLSFLVPQIHRSSSDRLACTVFFPLVVPSKYRISFLLSLSLSLSLLTVYPLLLRFHGNNSLPLSFSPLCRF